MGFLANMKRRGSAGNKAIKTGYKRTVIAYSEDAEKVLPVTLNVATVVIDTSPAGIQEDAAVFGGSVRVNGTTQTYKSEAAEEFAETVGDVFAADLSNAKATETPKEKVKS